MKPLIATHIVLPQTLPAAKVQLIENQITGYSIFIGEENKAVIVKASDLMDFLKQQDLAKPEEDSVNG
jgi:hypothetical protein